MKVIQRFICDICGTEYPEEEMCRLCEEYHVKPKRIEKLNDKKVWFPMKEGGSESNRYPKKISVEMEDGSVWVYEKSKNYTRNVSAKRDEKMREIKNNASKQKGGKSKDDTSIG